MCIVGDRKTDRSSACPAFIWDKHTYYSLLHIEWSMQGIWHGSVTYFLLFFCLYSSNSRVFVVLISSFHVSTAFMLAHSNSVVAFVAAAAISIFPVSFFFCSFFVFHHCHPIRQPAPYERLFKKSLHVDTTENPHFLRHLFTTNHMRSVNKFNYICENNGKLHKWK